MEIFGIGLQEIMLIAVVALIVLGPDRLPEAARTLGKGIADFRRAIEPARSAWADVTKEITNVVQEPVQALRNPWDVHPLAQGLSDKEKQLFFETGELPEWRRAEMDSQDGIFTNGSGGPEIGEVVELDYPMPHAPTLNNAPEPEQLYYPRPTGIIRQEEQG